MAKKNEHWWAVYRAIFATLHGCAPDRNEYSPRAGDATNAAFETLGLPTYAHADTRGSGLPDQTCPM